MLPSVSFLLPTRLSFSLGGAIAFPAPALRAEAGGGPVGIIPKFSCPAAIAAKLVEVTGFVLVVMAEL
jgi:hypothetical protein